MEITSVDIFDVKLGISPGTRWNPVIVQVNTKEALCRLNSRCILYDSRRY